MSFLLDTCALCDPTYPRPNAGLRKWFGATPESATFISVLSIGEIRKGLERLKSAPKAVTIGAWLDHELMPRFDRRLLNVDLEVCNVWGSVCGKLSKLGRPQPVIDSLIAATAIAHGLTLVTRNVRDFADFDIELVNPWT